MKVRIGRQPDRVGRCVWRSEFGLSAGMEIGMNGGLFRKRAMDGVTGPEQLNDYIRISNPAVWMVLTALCVLAAAVMIWGFTGKLPSTVNAAGVVQGGSGQEKIYCYLPYDEAADLKVGDSARVSFRNLPEEYGELIGRIAEIAATPLSYEEAAAKFPYDWLTQNLITDTYSVEIVIVPERTAETENGYVWSKPEGGSAVIAENTLVDVAVVTDEVRPIDFLWN
ncbi:MAG: hypothetical protein J6B85_10350 [Lachnospiraceae bacterium]|nr:hypothetical protein [Lachnospiraceae bacterium]